MDSNDLRSPKGARHVRKRVGRGHGCSVKTAGRGSNGQKSRSGGTKAPGFEGGQTPWYRRLPKFKGFKNRFRIEYIEVAVGSLERFDDGDVVTPEALRDKGIIRSLNNPVKLLGNGSLSRKLTVILHAFTEGARTAVENAGGKVEEIC
ncbi:50S ribosomal protein L15 [bacterium]|nr:50S ribosomal protein L15 [bacterium]